VHSRTLPTSILKMEAATAGTSATLPISTQCKTGWSGIHDIDLHLEGPKF
jgi:hypothetical protein